MNTHSALHLEGEMRGRRLWGRSGAADSWGRTLELAWGCRGHFYTFRGCESRPSCVVGHMVFMLPAQVIRTMTSFLQAVAPDLTNSHGLPTCQKLHPKLCLLLLPT